MQMTQAGNFAMLAHTHSHAGRDGHDGTHSHHGTHSTHSHSHGHGHHRREGGDHHHHRESRGDHHHKHHRGTLPSQCENDELVNVNDLPTKHGPCIWVEDILAICIELLPNEADLCKLVLESVQKSQNASQKHALTMGEAEAAELHRLVKDYVEALPKEYDKDPLMEVEQKLQNLAAVFSSEDDLPSLEKSSKDGAKEGDLRDSATATDGEGSIVTQGSSRSSHSKSDDEEHRSASHERYGREPTGLKDVPWFPPKSRGGIRKRIFIILEEERSSVAGKINAWLSILFIAVSTVAFIMESLPRYKSTPAECKRLHDAGLPLSIKACLPESDIVFFHIDQICVILFTIDYVLRMALVHADVKDGSSPLYRTFRYAQEPLNIVDLVAILPFYIDVCFPDAPLGFVRVLRLARVLRPFKMAKHNKGLMMFAEVLKLSGQPLVVLLAFNVLMIIFFGSMVFFAEGGTFSVDEESYPQGVWMRLDAQNTGKEVSPFKSIPYSLWFVCVTMTTVGYGDYSPTTGMGKTISIVIFYTGILFIAFPLGVLSSNFNLVYSKFYPPTNTVSPRDMRAMVLTRSMTQLDDLTKLWFPSGRGEGNSFRRRVFMLLHEPTSCRSSVFLSMFMIVAIFISVAAFIVETMPELGTVSDKCAANATVENCRPKPPEYLVYVEAGCVFAFTADYVMRVALVHMAFPEDIGIDDVPDMSAGRIFLRYLKQPLNLIDFLAVAPWYIELVAADATKNLEVLRIVRLARLLRLLRTPKIRLCADLFTNVIIDAGPAFITLLFTTVLMCILFASCMVFAESSQFSVTEFREQYPYGCYIRPTADGYGIEVSPFTSIPFASWWYFVTSTTVGYGDECPTTTGGRLIAVSSFYLGIVLLALPLTIVGQSFQKFYPKWVNDFMKCSDPRGDGLFKKDKSSSLEAWT